MPNSKQLPLLSIVMITVVFIAAYFGLRALPDAQCGFLLYEEVVNADGEIEFCATNHAGFLDLSRLEYPVSMDLEVDETAAVGGTVPVALVLETNKGHTIAPHELAITHERKMHVMLIDPAMEDYHHVHPEPDGIGGRYTFSFEPEVAGPYRMFTEIVPIRTRRQVIATGEIPVGAAASQPEFARSLESEVDGLRFRLSEVPDTLKTKRDYRLELDVSAADGSPADLETIMGAKGHMVAFDAAGLGFAHMHPIDSLKDAIDQEGLAFLFNVPNPGWYRLFAQVQVEGRSVYGRFDLLIE